MRHLPALGPDPVWGHARETEGSRGPPMTDTAITDATEDDHVALTKAPAPKPQGGGPFDDPFSTFREWDTLEDDTAFADL